MLSDEDSLLERADSLDGRSDAERVDSPPPQSFSDKEDQGYDDLVSESEVRIRVD